MKSEGMKSPMLPKAHWEKSVKQLEAGKMKYTEGMDNGEKLKQSNDAQVSYAKKHKMKY